MVLSKVAASSVAAAQARPALPLVLLAVLPAVLLAVLVAVVLSGILPSMSQPVTCKLRTFPSRTTIPPLRLYEIWELLTLIW